MPNDYSTTWFATFLKPIPPSQTQAELAFVARQLPHSRYRLLIDLCCGMGRHAGPLAARGYRVLGIDRDMGALIEARGRSNGRVTYAAQDMRRLALQPGVFDAVVCLWQSFGYFDAASNIDVLRQVHRALRPGGRLILDVYHHGFFKAHQGKRDFERNGTSIRETKYMTGDRLTVELAYGAEGVSDTFNWQLFTPDELRELGASVGFQPLIACTIFDERRPPSPTEPRMQLVFEKAFVEIDVS